MDSLQNRAQPLCYAYIAGILDGEGSIGIHKLKSSSHKIGYQIQPRIAISNTNLKLLKDLQKFTGFGTISAHKHKNRPTHKVAYSWTVLGVDIPKLLQLLLPYLRIKRKQALLAIRFYKHCHKSVKPLSEQDHKRRLNFYNSMKVLNKVGAKHDS